LARRAIGHASREKARRVPYAETTCTANQWATHTRALENNCAVMAHDTGFSLLQVDHQLVDAVRREFQVSNKDSGDQRMANANTPSFYPGVEHSHRQEVTFPLLKSNGPLIQSRDADENRHNIGKPGQARSIRVDLGRL